jgi:hypothetical protein
MRLRHVVLTKNDRVSSRRGPRVGYDWARSPGFSPELSPHRIVAVGRERRRETAGGDRRVVRAVNPLPHPRNRKRADEESDFSRSAPLAIFHAARARSVRPSVLAAALHNRELSYLMLQRARPVS